MNKKTKIIGVIVVNVVLGVFILECVKEKVDDFNQSPTKQMWDLYNESEKISNFWLVYNFNGETGNGGVEQFLYNCHDQVDITLQTLQDVHLENSTRYLAESKEICPEKIEMYSNDEITEKLNQKDDTYYDESERECNTFLLQYLKENKEHFMKES